MHNRFVLVITILLLLLATSAWSQDTRGTILGRIADPSGAVIVGAQVVVTNMATGTRTNLVSNNDGMYLAPLLIPGMYQVEVTATGFKKAIRREIEVRVADRLDISVTLEVGSADQSVTVTAEAPLLNTETASLGTVVDSKRVANLPLSYGNPFLLIGLTTGVTFNGSVRLDRPFEPTHIVNYSMGGTRGNLNDITIDGAPTTATANANEVTASYVPPTDIVQEFKVQTSTFDAQFGQTQGGVTTISIKSGTNQLHGSAGYSFQRQSMWCNDFFLNATGTAKPNFSFDRWGGAIGGPVYIPKVYDGRNKTFFMWGYEGIHDSRPRHDDSTNTIPLPEMHNGDFSRLLTAGSAYQIYNPYTRVQVGTQYKQLPFEGNLIPQTLWSTVGKNILDYYPTTEKTPNNDLLGTDNYRDPTLAEKTKYYTTTARVDQNLGDKQRFFVRYSHYIRNSSYNNYFDNAMMGQQFWFYSKAAAFDHVYTLTPTMILNTRYSYNRFIRGTEMPPSAVGFDLASLGYSANFVSQVPQDKARFPRLNYASTSYIGNGVGGEERPVNNHTVGGMLTKSAGVHSIKAGVEYRVYQEASRTYGNNQTIQYTLGSTWTKEYNNSPTPGGNYGHSIAELLLGLPDAALIVRSDSYIEQSGAWGFFVQDDWKVSPKFTVNLGLRYELETALHERFNRSTKSFDTSYVQPITPAVQANYTSPFPELPLSALVLRGGMTFPTVGGNGGALYETPKNTFLPRIGIAYQVTNKTVVRAGFGVFAGFLGQRRGDVYQNGFTQNTNSIISKTNGLDWYAPMNNPFIDGVTEPVGASQGYQTYLGQGFTFFNQNPKIPTTMRWEASLQREFSGFVLEANYVGSKTVRQEVTRNINALPRQYLNGDYFRDNSATPKIEYVNGQPTYYYLSGNVTNPLNGVLTGNSQSIYNSSKTARQNLLLPYPAFGNNAINVSQNIGYSWYHGLQFSLQKRFSKGYTIQGSYTFARWMQATNLLNATDPGPIEEVSDADAPHRINISGIWELPFGKGKTILGDSGPVVSRIVGGWQVSGIWSFQSGFPLAWNSSVFAGDSENIKRSVGDRRPEQWFNTDGFLTASNQQLVSTQLRWWPFRFSDLRGPRINNIDFAVIKDTFITEGKNLQFRAEALNAANHPLFASPNMTVTNSNFGKIVSSTQNNYARRLQISLRFVF